MGGLKNNWLFEIWRGFFVWLGHVASGGAEAKKGLYDEPPTLCIPRQYVVSMMAFAWTFGFPRVCPPINSALYLLFAFFSTAFSWEPFFFLLLLRPLLFLRKETRKFFCTGDFVLRHSFAAGDFASRQQSFSFRALFGTCILAICRSFCCVCLLIELGFWFVWALFWASSLRLLFECWHFVGVLGFFEGFFFLTALG